MINSFLLKFQLPHFPISIVEMLPKYGCIQLFWAREHDLARKAAQHRQNIVHERLRDDRIQKWFASEDDVSVTYRKGIGRSVLLFYPMFLDAFSIVYK